MKNLNALNKKQLIKLITQYDEYIIDICEDEQNIINRCPVCISEFLNNEFIENNEEE